MTGGADVVEDGPVGLGLEYVRRHDLRHTCAWWLMQARVSLHTVCEALGHRSLALTRQYAHLAPEHLADAIKKLA